MKIAKGFKKAENFESVEFLIELSHEELGLPDPKNRLDVKANTVEMTRVCEAMVVLEKIKHGIIPDSQTATEKLRPWLPNSQHAPNQTSSSTEQASPSDTSSSTTPDGASAESQTDPGAQPANS